MACKVNTKPLKEFVASHLREYPLVRQLILQEPDHMTAQEFVIKSKMWLRLLSEEKKISISGDIGLLHNRLVVRQ